MRDVTENDFRMPEFKDAKPEDYEFRADGKLVRKDRWEQGFRNISTVVDINHDWEIDEVVTKVEHLVYVKRLFIKAISLIDAIEINTVNEVDAINELKQFINDAADVYKSSVMTNVHLR